MEKRKPSALFVDSWFMSCRVFNRGMEDYVMNNIVEVAKNIGCHTVLGQYVPTAKNVIIKDIFANYGFVENNSARLRSCNNVMKDCYNLQSRNYGVFDKNIMSVY